jgi:hypothetical protein
MIVTEMVTDRAIMHHQLMLRVELFREDRTCHRGSVHWQLSIRGIATGAHKKAEAGVFQPRELEYMPRASDKIPESVTTSRRLLESQVDQRPEAQDQRSTGQWEPLCSIERTTPIAANARSSQVLSEITTT